MTRGRRVDKSRQGRALEELEEHLRDQYRFLRRSSSAYDDGDTSEAVRLAIIVRVLCHGGNALLHQLGRLRRRLQFVDTALNVPAPPGSFMIDFGLCSVRVDFSSKSVQPRALLDDVGPDRVNPPARFADWWGTPFLSNKMSQQMGRPGFRYSRSNVVVGLANHDGGAHVDPALPNDYEAFIDNDGGVRFNVNSQPVTISRRLLAAAWMRQIAHEVQRTLERNFQAAAILQGRPSGLPRPRRTAIGDQGQDQG